MKMLKRKKIVKILILLVGATAICWDIAVSRLEVVPGTFRYESEFDALSGATTKVGIVTSDLTELSSPVSRDIDPTYGQIEEMVAKAIELQGGLDWVVEKGDKVMIKVNLVGSNSASGEGTNTDVRVVKAVMRYIHQLTEGDVELVVAEGTARANDDPGDPESVWGTTGYIDLLTDTLMEGVNFRFLNLNQSIDDLVEVDLGEKGMSAVQGTKYQVHREELEADVYIAVPVLKIHDTGITNVLKLQIGTAPGCYYGYNKARGTSLCPTGIIHDVGYRVWTTEAIVDLSSIADIDFVVVDAIMCLDYGKTNMFWNQVRYNTILAGVDPVAVDHVSAKMMGLNPDDVAHITLAEKVGLGTNDPELIDIVGVPLVQVAKKVRKSGHHDGKYGQSNRTWTLSTALESTDFTKDFFVEEASIQPIPGQDGWSQPVYFFDDRIDLHAFYEGKTNIITYAFTYFYAEQDQQAELWLGHEEATSVYLNGERVYSFTTYTPYGDRGRGTSKGKVNIRQGKNTLLVKTLNQFGDFSFALNICEVESDPEYSGNRVDGLKFYLDESGTGTQLTGNRQKLYPAVSVLQCYPNPAFEYVTIRFEQDLPGKVSARIVDLGGKLIATLGNEYRQPGTVEYRWDLTTDEGSRVRSGAYLCTITSGGQQRSIRLVIQ